MLQAVQKTYTKPTGFSRIIDAFKTLIEEKDFSAITWEDISLRAEVNQGLIYRHFGNTRKLLLHVFKMETDKYYVEAEISVSGIHGVLNKLRKLIWFTIHTIDKDRCFARMLLIEVKANYNYLKAETDRVMRKHDKLFITLIRQGIESGEIRNDISPVTLSEMIHGAIEHICLPGVFYKKKVFTDKLTDEVCNIFFPGMKKEPNKGTVRCFRVVK